MRKVLVVVKDYNGSGKRCNLYLTKKLYFAENGQEFIEQEKLMALYRHNSKYLIKNVHQG